MLRAVLGRSELPRAQDHPKPCPMQRWLRLAIGPGDHHLSLAPPSCKYHTSFRLHDTRTPDQRKQKSSSQAKTRNRGTASTGERTEHARAVFQEMKERSVVTWNSMITEETNFGEGKKALALFQQMQQAGVAPDAFTFSVVLKACATEMDLEVGKQVHAQLLRQHLLPHTVLSNALISMYGKCGKLEDARAVFQQMKERDIVTWNSMITAYERNGQERKALATFDDMLQQGPDALTPKLLNAYSQARLVEEGASCFAAMREKHAVQPAAEHYNRMVDLLGRTGRGKEAETLLNSTDVAMKPLLANDGNDTERAGRAAQEVEIQNTKKVSQIFDELFGTSNKK